MGDAYGDHSVQSAGGHSCPDRAAFEALLERAGYVLVDEGAGIGYAVEQHVDDSSSEDGGSSQWVASS